MQSEKNQKGNYNLKHACELAVMGVLVLGCVYGCTKDYAAKHQNQSPPIKHDIQQEQDTSGLAKLAFKK